MKLGTGGPTTQDVQAGVWLRGERAGQVPPPGRLLPGASSRAPRLGPLAGSVPAASRRAWPLGGCSGSPVPVDTSLQFSLPPLSGTRGLCPSEIHPCGISAGQVPAPGSASPGPTWVHTGGALRVQWAWPPVDDAPGRMPVGQGLGWGSCMEAVISGVSGASTHTTGGFSPTEATCSMVSSLEWYSVGIATEVG